MARRLSSTTPRPHRSSPGGPTPETPPNRGAPVADPRAETPGRTAMMDAASLTFAGEVSFSQARSIESL